jgi:hypothetical protein
MKNIANEMSEVIASQRARVIFFGALLGLILSKGLSLTPGFALDDYIFLNQIANIPHSLGQGRYSQAAVFAILNNLGVSATSIAFPCALLFFIAAASAITLGILFATRSRGSVISQAGIAAIIGSHPYLTEYLTFRQSILTHAISFTLLALIFGLILYLEKSNPKVGLFGTVTWLIIPLLALAGTIQTALIVAFFFIISRLIIDSVTTGADNGIRQSLRNHSSLLVTFLLSAIIYAILIELSQKLSGALYDDRASLISILDIPSRFDDIANLLKFTFLSTEPVLSSAVKILLLVTIIGSILKIGINKPQVAMGCIVLFAILSAGSIFLVSISAVWWPVPRAIYGIGFTYGLTLVAISIWLDKHQELFIGIIITIALGLIFHSNAILYDQLRVNRWDLWTAGALAHDLANAGVKQEQKVYLVGAWKYSSGPKTAYRDLNISAFSMSSTAKYVMQEATGRKWDIDAIEGNSDVCPPESLWPSEKSIRTLQQRVIVCMGNP